MLPPDEKRIQIARKRAELAALYPSLWDKFLAAWNSPTPYDRGWLMYSANYLFFTQGVRWAIDPLSLNRRIPQAPASDAARDLHDLDFVLLTHRHADHLDPGLLRALQQLPIWWVVPKAILLEVHREAGIPATRILVPEPLQPIELHGIRITPFDGLHWQEAPDLPAGRRGVPAMGYLVEQGRQQVVVSRRYPYVRSIWFAGLWSGGYPFCPPVAWERRSLATPSAIIGRFLPFLPGASSPACNSDSPGGVGA